MNVDSLRSNQAGASIVSTYIKSKNFDSSSAFLRYTSNPYDLMQKNPILGPKSNMFTGILRYSISIGLDLIRFDNLTRAERRSPLSWRLPRYRIFWDPSSPPKKSSKGLIQGYIPNTYTYKFKSSNYLQLTYIITYWRCSRWLWPTFCCGSSSFRRTWWWWRLRRAGTTSSSRPWPRGYPPSLVSEQIIEKIIVIVLFLQMFSCFEYDKHSSNQCYI